MLTFGFSRAKNNRIIQNYNKNFLTISEDMQLNLYLRDTKTAVL